jgi:hypothetical protein
VWGRWVWVDELNLVEPSCLLNDLLGYVVSLISDPWNIDRAREAWERERGKGLR